MWGFDLMKESNKLSTEEKLDCIVEFYEAAGFSKIHNKSFKDLTESEIDMLYNDIVNNRG